MEKIVQYPFEVPPITSVIQRRLFTETIDALIEQNDIRLETEDSERLSELVAALAPALATPRAQTRFREQLLSFAGMLSFDEVDAVDFIALSFIRVFYHDVYEQIPAWKTVLQSGKIPLGLIESSDLSDAEWHEKIRPFVNRDDDALLVRAILSSLFPGIRAPGLLFFRDHRLALSNDFYFQRYFILGIAEDDIEDRLVSGAISRIIQGELEHPDVANYAEVLDAGDTQLSALALEKGEKFRSGQTAGSPELVRFLLSRLEARQDEDEWFASPTRALWRWLESEVFLALGHGNFTTAELQEAMSPEDLLSFIVRSIANHRVPDEEVRSALGDLNDLFLDLLANKLIPSIDSGINLPHLVDVCWWLSNGDRGDETVSGIGSNIVETFEAQDLERVIVGFVAQENFGSSDGLSPELVFREAALLRLFDLSAIRQIAERLPADRQLTQINVEDLSAENRRQFARAHVVAAEVPT